MSYPSSRQEIEDILTVLKRDILILSIKQLKISANAQHMIDTIDLHLEEMVTHLREVYLTDPLDPEVVTKFHLFLQQVLEEALGTSRLDQIILDDDTEIVRHVKNQFVQMVKIVKSQVN